MPSWADERRSRRTSPTRDARATRQCPEGWRRSSAAGAASPANLRGGRGVPGRQALPGAGRHGTMMRSSPPAVGAPRSQTSGPMTRASGGRSERSSRSHTVGWSPGSPNRGMGFPLTEPFGRGVTCVAISCGQGPANTTQYRASFATTSRGNPMTGRAPGGHHRGSLRLRDHPLTRPARSRARAPRHRSVRARPRASRRSCARAARSPTRLGPRVFTTTAAASRSR